MDSASSDQCSCRLLNLQNNANPRLAMNTGKFLPDVLVCVYRRSANE